MSQRWKAPLQHCGRVGRCIQWPLGFQGFPLIRDDEGLLDDIRCKGLNRNNRHQQISIEDFNETLSIWQTLWSFSAVPEERSRTSFHGAGHIPWTMSSVPLSDGCKSPMKMHRTSSCGCASSVITSIESKRRLQREAVACRGSRYNMWQLQSRSSLLFRLVTTVLPMGKEQRVDYASHVWWMHHRDPVFWCFLIVELCVFCVSWVMTGLSLHAQSWPWRPRKQEAMISKKSSNPILVEAGHMLVLLDTIVSGAYLLIYLIWWKCVSTCEYVTERLWNTYLGGSIMWW